MTTHTAIEATVIFEVQSFIKEKSIKIIKDIFKNTPLDPRQEDISRFVQTAELDHLIRLQTEELNDQDLDAELRRAVIVREKVTISSLKTTWNIFSHLARTTNDIIFEEYLIRGLPLWNDENLKRRMHSIMRYVYCILYRRCTKGIDQQVKIENFKLKSNEVYLYDQASILIKNKKFIKYQKKSEKLQKTLLGKSGIKNSKKLQNLKKNNIFFLYDKIDLENAVKDTYFVDKLTELNSYNLLNDAMNKMIAHFKSLREVLDSTQFLEPQGGMLDSDHRLSADINVKLPEFEINGLPEMLGFSGKPFVRASYSSLREKNCQDVAFTQENINDEDTNSSSYHTGRGFSTPSMFDKIFSWFKGFNYDHAVLLMLGLNIVIAKMAKDANNSLRRIFIIMLMAGSYYIMFLNFKKLYNLATEFPNLSNDTCDYFFNSMIYRSLLKMVSYVMELYTGKSTPYVVVNEDWDIKMDPIPENTATIEEIDPQSSFGDNSIIKLVVSAFLSYIAASSKLKVKPDATDIFLNFLNLRDYAVNNLMSLLTTTLTFVQDVFNYLFNTEVNFVSIFDTSKYSSEEARGFCEKVSDKLVGYHTGAKEVDTFSHEIFVEDMSEGNKILKKLERTSYDYQRVSSLLREYEKLAIQNKVTMKSLSGSRVEPVGLLLRGAPGTKKTVVLNRLARMVSKFTLPEMWKKEWEQNPDSFVYNIPNDKFWDGYTYKAWVAVSDDLFQQRDVAGDADSEALKVIKMINCNPFVLQMADVSMKNTKFFRSAFVMATSNLMDFTHLEAIRDPKAVARRFHVTLDVSVNPKYEGKFTEYDNSIRLQGKDIPASLLPNDYWIFKYNGTQISMSEVVRTLVGFHKDHICDYVSNIKSTFEAVKEIEDLNCIDGDSFGDTFMETLNDPNSLFYKIKHGGYEEGSPVERQSIHKTEDIAYVPFRSSVDQNIVTKLYLSDYRVNPDPEIKFTSSFCKTSSRVNMLTFFIKLRHDLYNDRLGDALSSLNSKDIISFLTKVNKSTYVNDFSLFNNVGFRPDVLHLDMFVYAVDGQIIVDIDLISKIFKEYCVSNKETIVEDKPDDISIMSTCWSIFKSILYDLYILVKENFVSILVFGAAGFVVIKMAQSLLKCFYPDSELVNIDLEELDKQDASPGIYHAKPAKKEKPKHSRKGDALRNNKDKVNWEGKPDSRRGLRLKHSKRQGLSLDGFDTSILAKVSVDDIDVMNCSDIVTKILNKYYFIVYLRDIKKDTLQKVGQSLNLVSNIFVMPHHFVDTIDNNTADDIKNFEIVMVTVNKRLIYRFTVDEFLDSGYATPESLDKDLVYMVLSNTQFNSCGAIRYIADNSDFDSISNRKLVPSCLVGVSLSQGGNTVTCKKVDSTLDTTSYFVRSESEHSPGYVITNTISYSSNSKKGDCGSLLVNECKTATGKCIMGMHIAGYGEKGVSATLNLASIEADFKAIGFDGSYLKGDEFEDFGERTPISIESQSGVHHTSVVPDSMSAPLPFKTDLVRSKFYGKLPEPYDDPSTLPAKLKPFFDSKGSYIDPYANGLLNYGKDQVCISAKVCSLAANDYLQQVMTHTANYSYDRKIPITLKESLHSFRDVGPIMSSTSAGWPLSLDKNNVKKRYYSQNSTEDERAAAYGEIETEINRLLDMYANGERPAFIYTDCLKDEKVSIEKCYLGKTRIFSACPFYLLVLFRMYFGAFMDAFITSNLDVGSAIGLNPYGPKWSYLVHKLKVHGRSEDGQIYVGAGDYSKFDGHEQPYLLNLIYRIISDWYGYTNFHATMMRKFLWAEITNSRHIHGKDVYEWFASMPSGNPLTSLINTMYNNLAFRVAWIFAGNEIADFQDNVYLAAMGDDNIFSVSPKFRNKFNELVMPELMRKVGMVYTTEFKKTAKYAFRPIQEVEFLKRSFKYDVYKQLWVAPLRFSAIIEILNWTKKGSKSDEIAVDNVGLVLREISLHGKNEFDTWYSTLDDLLKAYYKGGIPKGIYSSDHASVYSEVLKTDNFKY